MSIQQKRLLAVLVTILMGLFSLTLVRAEDVTPRPEADPADVESIDAIINAAYDSLTVVKGDKWDADRFRSLNMPDSRLMSTNPRHPNGISIMTEDGYVERSGLLFEERGFTEKEIGRKVDRYGDLAHVFSAYEGTLGDFTFRGINSFQLLYHNDRWWIVNVYWNSETEDNPLPEEYLFAE